MTRSTHARFTIVAATLIAQVCASGCAGADAQPLIELTAADLPPSAGTSTAGLWQSVAWQGDDWHGFPGEATLIVHHGLGRMPSSVVTYIAFDRTGQAPGLAAGDLSRVIEVTDAIVTIRNDTQADLFCRLVLQ